MYILIYETLIIKKKKKQQQQQQQKTNIVDLTMILS